MAICYMIVELKYIIDINASTPILLRLFGMLAIRKVCF